MKTTYAYSPDTGEIINTDTPSDWMGSTTLVPPVYDPAVSGCFFQNGAWVIVAAPILEAAQAARITELYGAYSAAIQLPVSYMGTTFQADESSQNVLTKVLVAGAVPAGFFWVDANNAQVPMTFAQLQGLAGAMLTQGQTAFAHLQAQKTAVKAAATETEVQAIVW
ncbi:MAG TPA: DUF4376 domain-containing protein [Gallionellaceae bacterium]|jgi:hypothetical protein|nr:DUF4376 domain-containing protein [Gallionellaceae bacterium]